MKVVKKIVINIVIVAWFVVALFATICLLSYNDYATTVFGKNTLLIMDSDELEPEYNEGDLLVVKRNSDNKINTGDRVFYYSNLKKKVIVYLGDIENKEEVSKNVTNYTIEGQKVAGDYVIGTTSSTKVYPNVGVILKIITSQWGFMFFVLFPMLFAVIYEIMMLVELRKAKKTEVSE